MHFVLATFGGAEEGEDEDDIVDCGFVEADAPPPATARLEDGDGWEEGGSAAERAAMASLSGLGQCERHPLCTRGYRHGGGRGPCNLTGRDYSVRTAAAAARCFGRRRGCERRLFTPLAVNRRVLDTWTRSPSAAPASWRCERRPFTACSCEQVSLPCRTCKLAV